jgi:hypothetical protein
MATMRAKAATVAGRLPKALQSALLPELALLVANARRELVHVPQRDRGRHDRKGHRPANAQAAANEVSAAFLATVLLDVMVPVAPRHVGPKVTAPLVRSTATGIALTGHRVVPTVSVRRGVSKVNAIALTGRHVAPTVSATEPTVPRVALKVTARPARSTATAIAATAHHVVPRANVRREVSKADATEPIARHVAPKLIVPAANAHLDVSKANAHLARPVRKANAGRTAPRHAPAMIQGAPLPHARHAHRTQAPEANVRRAATATTRASARIPHVPASAPTGVRPARDATPSVRYAVAVPNVPDSQKNAARATALSGLLRNP